MDRKNVDSVLVTSSDGTFIGVFRPQDLDVPKVAGGTHEA
jgi:hypothetical protein